MKKLFPLALVFLTSFANAQQRQGGRPESVKITGTVLDQETGQPLEYATLVLQAADNPDRVTGGITNEQGKFEVEAAAGVYNVSVEYISYVAYKLPGKGLTKSTDLGVIRLAPDVEQLQAVDVVGERTTVELRLDKKVYNVGSDLTVKGGSVTDVLGNVPSVSVDVEGNISLRGNESVRILINGKPSALSGLSPEALKQLPADAIEKVEVITNPSARYDAEGTAGILNIVLKQGKTLGLNGSVSATVGHPESYSGNLNLNLRSDKFNIFTNLSYRYGKGPGKALFEQENFNSDGSTASFQNEYRDYERLRRGFNGNVGFEYLIDSTSSITNSIVYGKSSGDDVADVDFHNFDAFMNPTIRRKRITDEGQDEDQVQYALNYVKNFNTDGHKLTIDYQYSKNNELENSLINETILGDNVQLPTEQTINDENQKSQLVQMDYVLPFGKDNQSQFEMGYRGTFNVFDTDFNFGTLTNGVFQRNPDFSNELIYKENVNAAYTQLGSKFGKVSVLGGLRMEASDIGIDLVQTNESNEKKYTDWFPSLFFGYEFSETGQFTVSYSRRLQRPRSRFINPFPSRSSNTNLFQGNPDLNPAYSNAYDIGYLKRWDKVTFSTSGYYNYTTGVFQFITQERGDYVEIANPDDPSNPIFVPVQVRTPVNLATDARIGMELTSTFTPKRDWRITLNLNLFQQQLRGDYSYVNLAGETINQNFDADNFNWFTRFSAKLPLPAKIDFQTNLFYMGPSKNAQSSYKGMLSTDLAFSKDVFKDKASISLNVSDLFNSRKRRMDTRTENVDTYSEFQFRQRQINLSFLYRFNQQKNQRENGRRGQGGGQDNFDFEG